MRIYNVGSQDRSEPSLIDGEGARIDGYKITEDALHEAD